MLLKPPPPASPPEHQRSQPQRKSEHEFSWRCLRDPRGKERRCVVPPSVRRRRCRPRPSRAAAGGRCNPPRGHGHPVDRPRGPRGLRESDARAADPRSEPVANPEAAAAADTNESVVQVTERASEGSPPDRRGAEAPGRHGAPPRRPRRWLLGFLLQARLRDDEGAARLGRRVVGGQDLHRSQRVSFTSPESSSTSRIRSWGADSCSTIRTPRKLAVAASPSRCERSATKHAGPRRERGGARRPRGSSGAMCGLRSGAGEPARLLGMSRAAPSGATSIISRGSASRAPSPSIPPSSNATI